MRNPIVLEQVHEAIKTMVEAKDSLGFVVASQSYTVTGTTYTLNFTGNYNGTATIEYTYVLTVIPIPPPPPASPPYTFSIDNVQLYYNDTTSGYDTICNNASGSYRFGFNGQEKNNEVSVEGGEYDFRYRIHDARLGRFLSVDILKTQYAWNSTYAFCENRVVDGVDFEGKEWVSYIDIYLWWISFDQGGKNFAASATSLANSTVINPGVNANSPVPTSTQKINNTITKAQNATVIMNSVNTTIEVVYGTAIDIVLWADGIGAIRTLGKLGLRGIGSFTKTYTKNKVSILKSFSEFFAKTESKSIAKSTARNFDEIIAGAKNITDEGAPKNFLVDESVSGVWKELLEANGKTLADVKINPNGTATFQSGNKTYALYKHSTEDSGFVDYSITELTKTTDEAGKAVKTEIKTRYTKE